MDMPLMRRFYYTVTTRRIREKRHEIIGWARKVSLLWKNVIYDTSRFARHSCLFANPGSRGNQRAKLTYYFHKIEKGLSIPNPRAGFGRVWISAEFLPLLQSYFGMYGYDRVVGSCCLSLQAYLEFNEGLNVDITDMARLIRKTLRGIESPKHSEVGGIKQVFGADIKKAGRIDFARFVNARHTIRNFSEATVGRELIEQAIEIAQRTPSVCNRQPWHVYGVSEKEKVAKVLKHQNGNEGFAENIQVLLIIAGDLSVLFTSAERNEAWVDSGMFSMSLVYALHSLGLGTCCLNFCYNVDEENELKQLIKMEAWHRPVMVIAAGHLPAKLAVAQSQRKLVSDVITWI